MKKSAIQRCLNEEAFIEIRILQCLVILPNESKAPGDLSQTNIPICLLDTLGEVFERMIQKKVEVNR